MNIHKSWLILLFSLCIGAVRAQRYADTVSTIPLLEAYTNPTDSVTMVLVTDSIRGGLFRYYPTALPDSGTVFNAWGIGSGYWVRDRSETANVYGKWFGITANGSIDETTPLQNAINYCINYGAQKLILPKGTIKTTSTISIGTASGSFNSAQTSFSIEGQGMNDNGAASGGGTLILYEGANTAAYIINLNGSMGRYFSMSNLSIAANVQNGAAIAFNFTSSDFNSFRFTRVKFANCDTLVSLNPGGSSANGEFTVYDGCVFSQSSSIAYYQNSNQSLSPKFIQCSFNPKAGSTVWYFATSVGGQFLNCDISFGSATSTPSTVVQMSGPNNDPLVFQGGRWEGVDKLVSFLSGTDGQSISFNGIVASINNRYNSTTNLDTAFPAVDYSSVSIGRANVAIQDCSFYISTANSLQQRWIINMPSEPNCTFYAQNVRWFNLIPENVASLYNNYAFDTVSTQALNLSNVRFQHCYINFVSGTAIKEIPLNYQGADNLSAVTYRQDNLLLQSKYGESTGSNISAPSPWVNTGSASFSQLLNLNSSSVNPNTVTPFGKRIVFNASSGVYQDITSVPISNNYSTWICYRSMISLNSNTAQLYIGLINSITGKIYAETTLKGASPSAYVASYVKHPVTLTAWVPANEAGYVRLIQENLSASGTLSADIYYQHISRNFDNTFVYNAASSTELTQAWDISKESGRFFNRFQLPFKHDAYGSATTLPEATGDEYLSQDSLTRNAYTDRWESYPRQARMAAFPTSGTWPQNFIVWNTNQAAGQPLGWVCVASGTPGTWQPFGTVGPLTATQVTSALGYAPGTNFVKVTSSDTAQTNYARTVIDLNASSGTIVLPDPTKPASQGLFYTIRTDTAGQTATVTTLAGMIETAPGTLSSTFSVTGVLSFGWVSDGSNWRISQ